MFDEERGFSADEMKNNSNDSNDSNDTSQPASDKQFFLDSLVELGLDRNSDNEEKPTSDTPFDLIDFENNNQDDFDISNNFDNNTSIYDTAAYNPSMDVLKSGGNNSYLNYNPSMDAFSTEIQQTPDANDVQINVPRPKKHEKMSINDFLMKTFHIRIDDEYQTGRKMLFLLIVGLALVAFNKDKVELEFYFLGHIFVFITFFSTLTKIRRKALLVFLTFAISGLFSVNYLFNVVHVQDYVQQLLIPFKRTSYVNMARDYVAKAREKYINGDIPSILESDGVYPLGEIYDSELEMYSPFGNLLLLDQSYIRIDEDSSVGSMPIVVYSIYLTDGHYSIGTPTEPVPAKELGTSKIIFEKK